MQRNIVTVVGTGDYSSTVENLFGTDTQVNLPVGVAVDSMGNLFYTDNSCKVRKWTRSSGIVTSYAGKSICGSIGDGGLATRAELSHSKLNYQPCALAVAVDASNNNLYIADQCNNVVRLVVASTGIITTFAGSKTGTSGSSGDLGAATNAQLNGPTGVAVGLSGALYIADLNNNKIRMVTSSAIITTIAGTGSTGSSGDGAKATSALLYKPYGVAADLSGNVYIADTGNYVIRMVTSSGIITTIAGMGGYAGYGYSGDGGPAASAQLYSVSGIAVDNSGNVYLADNSNRIRMVSNSATRMIFTVAGNSITADGLDNVAATSCSLYNASAVAIDASGNIFVADYNNYRIRMMYDNSIPNGLPASASPGSAPTTFPAPASSCVAGTYVSDSGTPYATCAYCPPSTYSMAGATACTPCPQGSVSGAFASACTPCPSGSYSTAGATCTVCPAGSFSAAAGASACSSCPSGQFSSPGASVCSSCPSGSYSTAGAPCAVCPAGSLSATAGASACSSCPSGQFSSPGASSCSQCSA